jgi:hypothetical protein
MVTSILPWRTTGRVGLAASWTVTVPGTTNRMEWTVAEQVPERAEGFQGLATAYLRMGEFGGSEAACKKALSIERRPPPAIPVWVPHTTCNGDMLTRSASVGRLLMLTCGQIPISGFFGKFRPVSSEAG